VSLRISGLWLYGVVHSQVPRSIEIRYINKET